MEELPFDTFRIKELEDIGLTKITKHLQDYYRTRRYAVIYGFTIRSTISHKFSWCEYSEG